MSNVPYAEHRPESHEMPVPGSFVVSITYLKKNLATLNPAYFALVMATGIVSIGCHLLGLREIAVLLFWINLPAYAILWLTYCARVWLFPSHFVADLVSHKRGFGFFTVVAATNVLGSQFYLLEISAVAAQTLWWVGLALWLLCTYSIFVLLAVQKHKPSIEEGINGGWLIAVVATQSISVLGTLVKPVIMGDHDFSVILLLSFWLFGGMLYIWLISLIFYRYMFFRFEPSDLIPPYWINMGAVAITTLAGAELVRAYENTPVIHDMLPFIKGLTTMYWATATWWIPMLLVLGVWRHGICRFKLAYDPLYWGLVFPLGMYAVCTLKLGIVLNIIMFSNIAHVFIIFALIAWLLTFLSMIKRPLYVALLMLRSICGYAIAFQATQMKKKEETMQNNGKIQHVVQRGSQGISDVMVGAPILILGIFLCSTTVTFVTGAANGEPLRFLTEGLIVSGLGCTILGAGVVRYFKITLEKGYSDDSI